MRGEMMADGTIYIDTRIDENSLEKEMKDTEAAIKKTEAKLDALIEKQIRFVETGGNVDSKAFKGMEYDIAQTRAALDSLQAKQSAFAEVSEKKVNRVKSAFKKLGTVLSNVRKKVLGIGKSANITSASLTKMIAKSLLMAFAFMALMAIMNGLKEGMNNLAQYSDDANKDLSALKSSLTQLKNSFATAFAPILSVVTPILTRFINLISDVVSKIGMLTAALAGKKTFTKAIEVQEDYAASLSDSANAAKDASKYTSGLDEITRFSDGADSEKSGNAKPSEMFEEVEIPNSFHNVADKIKNVFSSVIKKLKPFGNKVVSIFGKAVEFVIVAIKTLEPVFVSLWKGIIEPFGKAAGDIILNLLDLFGGLLDFLIGVFTGDWERAFSGLQTMVVSFGNIVESTFGWIEDVFVYFDDFLQKIFAIDWTEAFGEMGYGLNEFFKNVENIWSAVKQMFFGIIDFITGVFTGDLKKALLGIQNFFKGNTNALIAIAKIPVNAIVGLINGLIRGAVTGLNFIIKAMNKLSFTIPDWLKYVPGAGSIAGKKFGFDIKTVTAPQIPYLATGAVIPPNAPFMAMLGDQKHGTNLEAPESLLRQIVREETAGQRGGGSYRFTAQINRRTLFEEMIEEAKVVQMGTGLNPFELA